MAARLVSLAFIAIVLAPTSASAGFGKRSSSGANSQSSNSRPSGPAPSAGHRSYPPSRSFYSPWRSGYYSGAFVPLYGYGYGYGLSAAPYGYVTRYGYGYGPSLRSGGYDAGAQRESPAASLRITAGLEAMPYVAAQRGGFGLGGAAMFEGERWGVGIAFQNIAAPARDGFTTYDLIQQFNAHGTFAFLTGRFGRLRAELGADSFFAPNLIVLAPTGGLSGTLWLGGPVALEASVMGTPWPIRQLDARLGVVVGLGPVGLRAGWRTQVLDDAGLVDGIVNVDTFMGPYVGVSLAF